MLKFSGVSSYNIIFYELEKYEVSAFECCIWNFHRTIFHDFIVSNVHISKKNIYIWFGTDNSIFQMCLVDQITKYGDSSFSLWVLDTHSHTHSKFEKYHISYPLHPILYPLHFFILYPLHIPTPSGVGMWVG